jgi:hypothetical protein
MRFPQSVISGGGGQCIRPERWLQSNSVHSRNAKTRSRVLPTQGGKRTGLLFLELEDASQMAELYEPWFLAFNAEAYWSPAMVPADLQKAGPAIEEAVKTFG